MRRWPSDSLRCEPGLHLRDRLLVDAGEQAVGLGPRLLGGVAGDGVQPDAEADLAALLSAASSRIQSIFSATAAGGSPQVR